VTEYPYVWRWKGHDTQRQRCCIRGRQWQRCRVIARSNMRTALIEFEDGWRTVAIARGLKRP
jgi:hypothetical protein